MLRVPLLCQILNTRYHAEASFTAMLKVIILNLRYLLKISVFKIPYCARWIVIFFHPCEYVGGECYVQIYNHYEVPYFLEVVVHSCKIMSSSKKTMSAIIQFFTQNYILSKKGEESLRDILTYLINI